MRAPIRDLDAVLRALRDEEKRCAGFGKRAKIFVAPDVFLALLESNTAQLIGLLYAGKAAQPHLELCFDAENFPSQFLSRAGANLDCETENAVISFTAVQAPVSIWCAFKKATFLELDGVRKLVAASLTGTGAEVEVDARARALQLTIPCNFKAQTLAMLRDIQLNGQRAQVTIPAERPSQNSVKQIRIFKIADLPLGKLTARSQLPRKPFCVASAEAQGSVLLASRGPSGYDLDELRQIFTGKDVHELQGSDVGACIKRIAAELNGGVELQCGAKYELVPALFLMESGHFKTDQSHYSTRDFASLLRLLFGLGVALLAVKVNTCDQFEWEAMCMAQLLELPVQREKKYQLWGSVPRILLQLEFEKHINALAPYLSDGTFLIYSTGHDPLPREDSGSAKAAGLAGPQKHRLWTGKDMTVEVTASRPHQIEQQLRAEQITVDCSHIRPHLKEDVKRTLQNIPGVERVSWSAEGDLIILVRSALAAQNARSRISKIKVDGIWLQGQ